MIASRQVDIQSHQLRFRLLPFYRQYKFNGRRWKSISKEGKAFVKKLLVVDPEQRATSNEALRESWLNRRGHVGSTSRRTLPMKEIEGIKQSIKKFAGYSKLRQVALMVVAHRSTSTEIDVLRKAFRFYDKTGSGNIGYEEFKAALHDAGYSDENYYRDIFEAVDIDGSGLICYTEFVAATIEATGTITEERLAEAFDRVDHDDTG